MGDFLHTVYSLKVSLRKSHESIFTHCARGRNVPLQKSGSIFTHEVREESFKATYGEGKKMLKAPTALMRLKVSLSILAKMLVSGLARI